jgi:hypothetical protein
MSENDKKKLTLRCTQNREKSILRSHGPNKFQNLRLKKLGSLHKITPNTKNQHSTTLGSIANRTFATRKILFLEENIIFLRPAHPILFQMV